MSKDINYNCVILYGNDSIEKIQSVYTFMDIKTINENEEIFTEEKQFLIYGNANPEDDMITPEMLGQAQALFSAVRTIVYQSLNLPGDVDFYNQMIRVEDIDLDENSEIDIIEAYYKLEYNAIKKPYTINVMEMLSSELKAGIQSLFDAGLVLTKQREGIE
jgi:hypothetical protein